MATNSNDKECAKYVSIIQNAMENLPWELRLQFFSLEQLLFSVPDIARQVLSGWNPVLIDKTMMTALQCVIHVTSEHIGDIQLIKAFRFHSTTPA